MTPRRSSGGPQCAFEENKKERESRVGERARESSRERKSRRAPARTSPGPRGHREPLFVEGRGRPLQPQRPGCPNAAWGGL